MTFRLWRCLLQASLKITVFFVFVFCRCVEVISGTFQVDPISSCQVFFVVVLKWYWALSKLDIRTKKIYHQPVLLLEYSLGFDWEPFPQVAGPLFSNVGGPAMIQMFCPSYLSVFLQVAIIINWQARSLGNNDELCRLRWSWCGVISLWNLQCCQVRWNLCWIFNQPDSPHPVSWIWSTRGRGWSVRW